MDEFDEKFDAAMEDIGCRGKIAFDVDDAVAVTAKVLDIGEHDARLMVREAIASGELVGFRREGDSLQRLTPDDIVRPN